MTRFDSKRMYWLVTGVLSLIWIFTFYQGVVSSPGSGYYTHDENFIADSGVFLWYGNTPRCLDWPAAPSVLLFFFMFGIVALYSILTNAGSFSSVFDALEHFDYQAYTYLSDHQDFIIAGRAIQLFLVGVVLLLTVRFLFRSAHPLLTPLLALVLSLIIVTSYVVWFNAPFLRPEALSGTLFIYLLTRIFFAVNVDRKGVLLWAVLFAIIVAERLIFLFVSPIIFVRIFEKLRSGKWLGLWQSIGVAVVTFVVFCPFIFTDPFVIFKAFGGGILAKMQDAPMPTFFNHHYIGMFFGHPVSYLILALSVLGVIKMIRRRKVLGWVVTLNLLLFLFLVLRSSKIYDTHVLPAGVITLFLTAFGIGFLLERFRKGRLSMAMVLVAVIAIANLAEVYSFQIRSHQRDAFDKAFDWVSMLPEGTRLLVPPGSFELMLPRTLNCLQRNFAANRDEMKKQRKIRYLLGAKDTGKPEAFPVVANSFLFEDEALYETQYSLLMKYNHLEKKRFDYDVYIDNDKLANTYVLFSNAIKEFEKGNYSYLISQEKLEGLQTFKEFSVPGSSSYYVYKSTASPIDKTNDADH